MHRDSSDARSLAAEDLRTVHHVIGLQAAREKEGGMEGGREGEKEIGIEGDRDRWMYR